jgi:hypothetical protein
MRVFVIGLGDSLGRVHLVKARDRRRTFLANELAANLASITSCKSHQERA